MPELPEVETVARTLRPHVCGRKIVSAQLLRATTLHPLSLPLSSLLGRTITGTGRRGKLLIFQLDEPPSPQSPTYIVVHLRMTGRVLTREANFARGKHTRCVLGMENESGGAEQLFF